LPYHALWFDLDGLWEDRRDSHKGPRQAAPTVTDILVNARAGECVGNALTIFALPVLAIENAFAQDRSRFWITPSAGVVGPKQASVSRSHPSVTEARCRRSTIAQHAAPDSETACRILHLI
jgi:hypothetical protein